MLLLLVDLFPIVVQRINGLMDLLANFVEMNAKHACQQLIVQYALIPQNLFQVVVLLLSTTIIFPVKIVEVSAQAALMGIIAQNAKIVLKHYQDVVKPIRFMMVQSV